MSKKGQVDATDVESLNGRSLTLWGGTSLIVG
jgi:hypothetical protein